MAILQFPVDPSRLGDNDEFIALNSDYSVAHPSDDTSRRIVEIIEFISRGDSSTIPPENLHEPFVLRARLDTPWDGKDTVICKAGYGKKATEKLRKEAQIYNGKLSGLQGICVPWIYGYYTGCTAEDGRLSVLVMEDCGQPLPRSFNKLPQRAKKLMLQCLINLHKAGVEHCGIDDRRNIAIRPSETNMCEIRLVDFGDADDDHICEVNREFLEDSTEPNFDRVGCEEIYQVCMESEIWDMDHVTFYDKAVPVDQLTSAENLLEVTNILNELKEHEDLRDWEARGAAQARIDDYRDWCQDRKCWESTPLFS
ncbi:hypothetical protein CONPUDRAFT_170048 [Coniophora puteana RWD-64-598 SS2]|uniref:Protein kinase domain-containing protein n=1 Tax=Coniophora puteana (strain RWD-64-598) TaxID=741705 RepID=R7SI64_CONPW|nr:uncharacterized protein CONPUDRAFT_170048 [Coniophora puteana RWD-64-598 SS2]EIW74714.1 hypothetical protein CONPUDRAFT_170048 [Coniophora puteana RWD-64-598 SS2]